MDSSMKMSHTTALGLDASAARARGAFHLLVPRALPGAGIALEVPGAGLLLLADAARGARVIVERTHPAAVALEPVMRSGLDLLLLLRGPAAELAVNGLPAARVAVLRCGDELWLGAGPPLFIDFYRAPPFMLADAEQSRSRCQLCRGAIEAGQRVFRCECGALAHADQGPAGAEKLDCAFGGCTSCARAIVTESGYANGGFDALAT